MSVGRPGLGSLVVIGTGIQTVGQLTIEAIASMKNADAVLYVVADPIAVETIRRLNPSAQSLSGFYVDGQPRIATYAAMAEHTMSFVRQGKATCLALYGHPGVFAFPAHEAIRRARAEGYTARMLPGISAEDCLFADLGVDPADQGCQSYEATDFLNRNRVIDPRASLILWQIGVLGHVTYREESYPTTTMPHLIARLCRHYPPTHPCVIYEASVLPGIESSIVATEIAALDRAVLSTSSTLYIPPAIDTSSENHT